MVEVGIRELKSRLSYYVQLMQAGETIAIKVREKIVGFLTNMKLKKPKEPMRLAKLDKTIAQLKKEGLLLSGGRCRMLPFRPVRMTPGSSSTEMIRKMRDEEE